MSEARYPTQQLRFFATGLDHPEGLAVSRDGVVYAGGEAGQVYRISEDGKSIDVIARTGGYCLGIALDRDDRIYICDCGRKCVIRVDSKGQVEVFASEVDGHPFQTPNFGVFDRKGNLYVSDSGDWEQVNGRVYRITPAGHVSIFHPGPFYFANGLALTDSEDHLYVVETTAHRVLRIPIRPDGSAGSPEVFVDEMLRVPDGLAFDASQSLYVTCYASDVLYRVTRDGVAEMLCRDENSYMLNRPTNCAFSGLEGNKLLIANVGGEFLTELTLPERGMPLFHQQGQP
ncbi:MAG TPA: SMP-30/gluconolactonase/LRE family protein [Terriglobia bacterium]|nr:SMP-30/gluconolactonase/LRE family protein [Terriglobia bacterium]